MAQQSSSDVIKDAGYRDAFDLEKRGTADEWKKYEQAKSREGKAADAKRKVTSKSPLNRWQALKQAVRKRTSKR